MTSGGKKKQITRYEHRKSVWTVTNLKQESFKHEKKKNKTKSDTSLFYKPYLETLVKLHVMCKQWETKTRDNNLLATTLYVPLSWTEEFIIYFSLLWVSRLAREN